jgi:hypothetical protein
LFGACLMSPSERSCQSRRPLRASRAAKLLCYLHDRRATRRLAAHCLRLQALWRAPMSSQFTSPLVGSPKMTLHRTLVPPEHARPTPARGRLVAVRAAPSTSRCLSVALRSPPWALRSPLFRVTLRRQRGAWYPSPSCWDALRTPQQLAVCSQATALRRTAMSGRETGLVAGLSRRRKWDTQGQLGAFRSVPSYWLI